MGPTWGRQDQGGSHVGPMNLAIRVYTNGWLEGMGTYSSKHEKYIEMNRKEEKWDESGIKLKKDIHVGI